LATVSTGIGLPQNLHIDVVGMLGIHSRTVCDSNTAPQTSFPRLLNC